jgi:hypothetical protein
MADPRMAWARFLEGDGAGGTDPKPNEGEGNEPGDGEENEPDPNDEGEGGEGNEPGDGEDPEGAEALGDAGKKALREMKQKWRAEQRRARELEQRLAQKDAPKEGELTPEQIRAQAKAEARAELAAPTFKTAAKAVARSLGFNDPTDALHFVAVSDFEQSEDGSFDEEDIADRLSEVLEQKPYLAKTQPGNPAKTRLRKVAAPPAKNPPKELTLDQKIADARAKGDWKLEISLQNQKFAQNK